MHLAGDLHFYMRHSFVRPPPPTAANHHQPPPTAAGPSEPIQTVIAPRADCAGAPPPQPYATTAPPGPTSTSVPTHKAAATASTETAVLTTGQCGAPVSPHSSASPGSSLMDAAGCDKPRTISIGFAISAEQQGEPDTQPCHQPPHPLQGLGPATTATAAHPAALLSPHLADTAGARPAPARPVQSYPWSYPIAASVPTAARASLTSVLSASHADTTLVPPLAAVQTSLACSLPVGRAPPLAVPVPEQGVDSSLAPLPLAEQVPERGMYSSLAGTSPCASALGAATAAAAAGVSQRVGGRGDRSRGSGSGCKASGTMHRGGGGGSCDDDDSEGIPMEEEEEEEEELRPSRGQSPTGRAVGGSSPAGSARGRVSVGAGDRVSGGMVGWRGGQDP